ncbi:MAG: TraC family protein [Gammaproteobacteria bacterium]|nr:TraC family protein [Gammaproteobacteria bacterium]
MNVAKSKANNSAKKAYDPAEAPATTAAVQHLYDRPPSFTDLMPWVEYDPDSRTFLLEDGVSVGAC